MSLLPDGAGVGDLHDGRVDAPEETGWLLDTAIAPGGGGGREDGLADAEVVAVPFPA